MVRGGGRASVPLLQPGDPPGELHPAELCAEGFEGLDIQIHDERLFFVFLFFLGPLMCLDDVFNESKDEHNWESLGKSGYFFLFLFLFPFMGVSRHQGCFSFLIVTRFFCVFSQGKTAIPTLFFLLFFFFTSFGWNWIET
jgi:hypothetical protein